MDVTRAHSELGSVPRHDAASTLRELLAGMRAGAGAPTPPLDPEASGPLRRDEVLTGVGGREG